jgi:hypothetical protein
MPERKRIEHWRDHTIPVPWSGCWLWEGYVRSGYGRLRGKSVHRLAWEEVNGPIPAGLSICHRCDVRLCCNPEHLFLGTNADNNRDMSAKGRNGQSKKTHCPQGHEYSHDNTYITIGGRRACRLCTRIKQEARYRRNPATVRAYYIAHKAEYRERDLRYKQKRREARALCQE